MQNNDLYVMKLLHYFITIRNYKPIIIKGIENEIWLENMDEKYKVIRIVMSHIHNSEQYEYDLYKVSRLIKQIKLKTLTFKLKILSLYLDLEDRVELINNKNIYSIETKSEKDLLKNKEIKDKYNDIQKNLVFSEKGSDLFKKINKDILKKNTAVNKQVNDLFSKKKVIITYILIGINILVFLLMYLFGRGSTDIATIYYFGGLIKGSGLFRIIASMFIHIGVLHLLVNCYSLHIIGNEIENFYGKYKLIYIYLFSGIIGNLVTLIFMNSSNISAGASGAVFGLVGALLYFALNYRIYFGEAIKSQIIPIILINLMLGFAISNVNNFAHIGGLIGGILAAITVGIKDKTSRFEKVNGLITSVILVGMLLYFIYK